MEPLWKFEKKYTENGVWMSIEIPGSRYRIEKEVHWRDESGLETDLTEALAESVCGTIESSEFVTFHCTTRDEKGRWSGYRALEYKPLGIRVKIQEHDG